MGIGIVTDAHSNPWGQEAVIHFLRKEGIKREDTFDLGDLVGMFPRCADTVKIARAESAYGILGNHDAMLLRYFADNPLRTERIAALGYNSADLSKDQEGVLEYLKSLPTSISRGGISFVHNSPFHTNPYDESQMHFRFDLGMKEISEEETARPSLASRVLHYSDQLIVRGHAHAASVYTVKRDLITPSPEGVKDATKPREGSVSARGDRWEIELDPDHKYVLVSASACGANTMFTPDSRLDYRPAGLIIEYDTRQQRGKATFFTVVERYDHQKFIDSVVGDVRWSQDVFAEAQRQIRHLQAGTLLGDH